MRADDFAVELVRGRLVDPRFAGPGGEARLVVNAYREGDPVGWARAESMTFSPTRTVRSGPQPTAG